MDTVEFFDEKEVFESTLSIGWSDKYYDEVKVESMCRKYNLDFERVKKLKERLSE